MIENKIPVTRTARFFTHGNLNENTKQIWFVLHGYGQLSNYFLRWFEGLDPEEHFVVAPEGLHRFYLDGFSGRVGASWMTKEDRLTDIEDYIAYLDQLFDHVVGERDTSELSINALGFSQGAATVTRWITRGNSKVDNFILWAGVFPPDVAFEVNKPIFDALDVHFVIGDDDEFIDDEKVEAERDLLTAHGIKYTLTTFPGKHKVDAKALEELARVLK